MTTALLTAHQLIKTFDIRKGLSERLLVRDGYLVRAVDGVSFEIARGQTLGLIGESGCGKSTLARVVLRLQEPTSGDVHFDGREIGRASPQEMRALRSRMQIVFQDPFASLNPRRTVGQIIELPLTIHEPRLARTERRERAAQFWNASACRHRTSTAIRTSSPVASVSASTSLARSSPGPTSSSATRRYPRSTLRCRPRS